jgi:hypothetical protein
MQSVENLLSYVPTVSTKAIYIASDEENRPP